MGSSSVQSAALVQRLGSSIAEVGADIKTQRASRVVLRATVARWRIDHTRVRAASAEAKKCAMAA